MQYQKHRHSKMLFLLMTQFETKPGEERVIPDIIPCLLRQDDFSEEYSINNELFC